MRTAWAAPAKPVPSGAGRTRMVRVSIRPRPVSLVAAATGVSSRAGRSAARSGSAGCPGPRGRQTTTFPCLAAVRGRGHGAGSSAVRVPGSGLRVPACGRGAAFEGGIAGRDAGPCRGGRDRCVRRGAGGCRRGPGSGRCWPAASAGCGDAAAGRGPGRRAAVTGWAGPCRWRLGCPVRCRCLLPCRRRLGAALLSPDSGRRAGHASRGGCSLAGPGAAAAAFAVPAGRGGARARPGWGSGLAAPWPGVW